MRQRFIKDDSMTFKCTFNCFDVSSSKLQRTHVVPATSANCLYSFAETDFLSFLDTFKSIFSWHKNLWQFRSSKKLIFQFRNVLLPFNFASSWAMIMTSHLLEAKKRFETLLFIWDVFLFSMQKWSISETYSFFFLRGESGKSLEVSTKYFESINCKECWVTSRIQSSSLSGSVLREWSNTDVR